MRKLFLAALIYLCLIAAESAFMKLMKLFIPEPDIEEVWPDA